MKKKQPRVEEYLRRNLIHAASVGAECSAVNALKRVKSWSRPPRWLVASLEIVVERAVKLPAELAIHRDRCSLGAEG